MKDKMNEQKEFSELYGAITLLGAMMDSIDDKMISTIPGAGLLFEKLAQVHTEMNEEVFRRFYNIMVNLNKDK